MSVLSAADDEDAFLRQMAERAYDSVQLANIAAMQDAMVDYAQTAWRPMTILPVPGVLVIAAVEAGIALMLRNHMGEWRDNKGMPAHAPRAWMPAPKPPT